MEVQAIKKESEEKPKMAEFLKIMLTGATEEEQAIFESTPAEFSLTTMEKTPETIKEFKLYTGKDEILEIIKRGIPQNCYFEVAAIDEVKKDGDNEAQIIYISKLYLIEKPTEKNIPQAQSIRPNTAIINNSKMAKALKTIEADTREYGGSKLCIDRKKQVNIKVSLNYDDVVLSGRPLTAFDKVIYNTVCSLYEAGNEYFNLAMIYRAMNGQTDSEYVTKEALKPIEESIEASKMRIFKYDATEQAKAWNGNIKAATYEGYFLPVEKLTVQFKNSTTPESCYRFLKAPPLFNYSKGIKQIISHDIKLLDTSKTVGRYTPELAVIKEYLIQRISDIKSNKNTVTNTNIKYSSLFAECDIDEATLTPTEKNRKRDRIKKLLDHLKANGFIKDYSEYKKGRSLEGITIII